MPRRKKSASKRAAVGDAMKRGVVIAFAALIFACLLFAVWGSIEIRQQVREEPRYRIAEWRVEFADLPAWVTPEIRDELQALGEIHPEVAATLFDRGALDGVRRRFEASPWVDRVDDMQLSFPTRSQPGAVAVAVSLRRPLALVEFQDVYYLMDGEGRRLGEPYDHPPVEWFGVPTIVGVEADEAPPPGVEWTSPAIMHGLEVARILHKTGIWARSANLPIDSIDVVNLNGQRDPEASEIVLRRGRQRLTWGRSPLSTAPRILSLEGVLRNLAHVIEHEKVFERYRVIHLHRRDMTGFRGGEGGRTDRVVHRAANVAPGTVQDAAWPVPSSGPIE